MCIRDRDFIHDGSEVNRPNNALDIYLQELGSESPKLVHLISKAIPFMSIYARLLVFTLLPALVWTSQILILNQSMLTNDPLHLMTDLHRS